MEIISKITLSFLLLLLKIIFEILKSILLNQFVVFFFGLWTRISRKFWRWKIIATKNFLQKWVSLKQNMFLIWTLFSEEFEEIKKWTCRFQVRTRRFNVSERKNKLFETKVWFPCTKNPDEIGDSNSCYSQIVSSSGLKPPFANRNCCYQSSGSDSNAYYSQMVSSSGLKPPFANSNRCCLRFHQDSSCTGTIRAFWTFYIFFQQHGIFVHALHIFRIILCILNFLHLKCLFCFAHPSPQVKKCWISSTSSEFSRKSFQISEISSEKKN